MQKTNDTIESDDDVCPATGKRHEPNWKTISVDEDGDVYIDIACKDCGRSGCIGTAKTIAENINW